MLQGIFQVLVLGLITAGAYGDSKTYELGEVAQLDEENWRTMLQEEWMVQFHAPWCPACRHLSDTWNNFGSRAAKYGVRVGKVDVTTSPALSGRFFVTALPTIYHVIDGDFRKYNHPRDSDSLLIFVKEKQWKSVDPVSYWKKPNSIQMSVLAQFFKLSHVLKNLNTHFHTQFGLPTWCSYTLFGIGTILLGSILGLILVCLVDLLYPPKNTYRQSFSEAKGKVKESDGIEEIAGDELEDEDSDNDESTTSEAEKNSGCDSDASESVKTTESVELIELEMENKNNVTGIEGKIITSSPEVRKRKPRFAD